MKNTIAVLHPDFIVAGGAESVCFATLEALQTEYDITLFSYTEPDFGRLNDYFGTDVDPDRITVERVGRLIPTLYGRFGKRFGVLTAAYFGRIVAGRARDHDLVLSTQDEFPISGAVQYLHFPRFNRKRLPDDIYGDTTVNAVYDRVCRAVSGFDRDHLTASVILTNSEWTARIIDDVYGVTADVVYPPVDVERFAPTAEDSWTDRESGFVSVGRLSPDKNLLRNIDIVARLNREHPDVHLHIVGPSGETAYAERVRRRARKYDCVHVEAAVPFEELVALLQTHRYGLHGKENEHFGMSVAEMVAAGMIPFVPDSGGQTDIVGQQSSVLYHDTDEAVSKISTVLSDPDRQRAIKKGFPVVSEQYGRERFIMEIRSIVDATLSGDERRLTVKQNSQ